MFLGHRIKVLSMTHGHLPSLYHGIGIIRTPHNTPYTAALHPSASSSSLRLPGRNSGRNLWSKVVVLVGRGSTAYRTWHWHTWKICINCGLKGTLVGCMVRGSRLWPWHGHIWIIHIKCGLQGTFVGCWVSGYHLGPITKGSFAWRPSGWIMLLAMPRKIWNVLTVLRVLPLGGRGLRKE